MLTLLRRASNVRSLAPHNVAYVQLMVLGAPRHSATGRGNSHPRGGRRGAGLASLLLYVTLAILNSCEGESEVFIL